jgi:ketosteroid isomerase-like protein
VLPFTAEDVLIYSMPEWPDDSEYHGHAGFRKLTQQWTDNFDDFDFVVADVRDGGDMVVALLSMTGRMKRLGVPMSAELGAVFSEITDGLPRVIRFFGSWPDALAAAGLPE